MTVHNESLSSDYVFFQNNQVVLRVPIEWKEFLDRTKRVIDCSYLYLSPLQTFPAQSLIKPVIDCHFQMNHIEQNSLDCFFAMQNSCQDLLYVPHFYYRISKEYKVQLEEIWKRVLVVSSRYSAPELP